MRPDYRGSIKIVVGTILVLFQRSPKNDSTAMTITTKPTM